MTATSEFLAFAAVGAGAQLIDGALGMGYGVVSSTVLLSLGVPPANVSASVHSAKAFTGAASAISHWLHGNVDKKLLLLLSIGGVIGGVAGTYLLTNVSGGKIKPFVVAWLFLMGAVILYRAWRAVRPKLSLWSHPLPLGMTGGFFDAIGGGGWGPVVTSTLVGGGSDPRKAIGTTNAAEFFVAAAVSGAFFYALVYGDWEAAGLRDNLWSVVGLIAGGIVTAPIAGWTTKKLPLNLLMWFVGLLVVVLAAWQGFELWRHR